MSDKVEVRVDATLTFAGRDCGADVDVKKLPLIIPVEKEKWDAMDEEDRGNEADDQFWEHCRTFLSNIRVISKSYGIKLNLDLELAIIEDPDDDTSILKSEILKDVFVEVPKSADEWDSLSNEDIDVELQALVWEMCSTHIDRIHG